MPQRADLGENNKKGMIAALIVFAVVIGFGSFVYPNITNNKLAVEKSTSEAAGVKLNVEIIISARTNDGQDFSSSPLHIFSGQRVEIRWQSVGAQHCLSQNGWSKTNSPNGQIIVDENVTLDKDFNITCYSSSGSTKSATMKVLVN